MNIICGIHRAVPSGRANENNLWPVARTAHKAIIHFIIKEVEREIVCVSLLVAALAGPSHCYYLFIIRISFRKILTINKQIGEIMSLLLDVCLSLFFFFVFNAKFDLVQT